MRRRLSILLATPAAPGSRKGNRVTALRWARALRRLGHRVRIAERLDDRPVDLLVALHATKSHPTVVRYREEKGAGAPLVVALTGTDLYGDLGRDPRARESIELATRLVVLQPRALDALPAPMRSRARPIIQSASPPRRPLAPAGVFQVCVLAHLRSVKDPARAAEAARRLPASSRVSIVHLGEALDAADEARARAEMRENPRYRWLGPRPRLEALRVLSGSKLLVVSSELEGGANAVTEAIACGVPVLSTRIDGSLGLLGERYPGYFPVGDAEALAALLARAENDAGFYQELQAFCAHLAPMVHPDREVEAWRALLAELSLDAPLGLPNARAELSGAMPRPERDELADDVRAGLAGPQKRLSCRFFYDAEGSALFEAICATPEYYLYRAEHAILSRDRDAILDRCPCPVELVELGGGSAGKTRLLIESLSRRQAALRYVSLDVSRAALSESVGNLLASHATLEAAGLVGDYQTGLGRLPERRHGVGRLFLFLGSNIGNFGRPAAAELLGTIRERMTPGDRLLVGFDLRKDARTLERAYDDAQGVTARFNKNLLARVARELGAAIDLDAFVHRAVYEPGPGRVRMYLASARRQHLRIDALDLDVALEEGELIHTEDSYKYSLDEIVEVGQAAGLRVDARFVDAGGRFCDALYAPAVEGESR